MVVYIKEKLDLKRDFLNPFFEGHKEEYMNKNSLLSMRDLSVEDIYSILDDARLFNSSFKDWQ